LLVDGSRQIIGVFAALDHTGTITLRDAVQAVEENEREIGIALIPLALVQSMELAE
jgi:hypothetical protein